MKRFVGSLVVLSLMLFPVIARGMGAEPIPVISSPGVQVTMNGWLKALPTFMGNVDFNSKQTSLDRVLDENGWMADHDVRTEARIGWKAKAKDWDFMMILEADFNLNKVNNDRQIGANNTSSGGYNPNAVTANSDGFGIEKINFGYDFGPMKVNVGWDTRWVDLMTGGLILADDHPYISLNGKFGEKNTWDLFYFMIQDDIYKSGNGVWDGDTLDWRAYTLRVGFDVNGYTVAPIYAFSDNNMRGAQVHYLGVEGYGKVGGIFTPRFELVYAFGDKDILTSSYVKTDNYDISAWAAFASLDISISKALVPYFGGYYLSGDDDKNDRDINAYNGIAMNQRYTPTFGMEAAFIYKFVPALGSFLYENGFQNLGSQPGYGGSSNGQMADAPGLIMFGAGLKGVLTEEISYKTQLLHFSLAKTDNFTKINNSNKHISSDVGWEYDLQLTYKFSPNFSLGNVVSVFMPGDSVKDRLGKDYDATAVMDTIEMNWAF
jgi:hypothetical protein